MQLRNSACICNAYPACRLCSLAQLHLLFASFHLHHLSSPGNSLRPSYFFRQSLLRTIYCLLCRAGRTPLPTMQPPTGQWCMVVVASYDQIYFSIVWPLAQTELCSNATVDHRALWPDEKMREQPRYDQECSKGDVSFIFDGHRLAFAVTSTGRTEPNHG
jgi:hypothetical protein